jgi:hypothetical protein
LFYLSTNMSFETVIDRLNANMMPLFEGYSHLTSEFKEREEQLKILFILAVRNEILTLLNEKNIPKNKWKTLLFSFLANKKFNMAFFQRKIRKCDSSSNENYRYSVLLMLVDMELDFATYKWTTAARKQDLMQTAIEMLWSVSQVTQFDKPLPAPSQEQRNVLEQYRLAIINAMQHISFLSPASAPAKITGRKRRIAQVYESDASDCNSSMESNESDEVVSSASSPCSSPVHIAKKYKPSVQEFPAFSSNPASQVLYINPSPIFFNPLPHNAQLLNPSDYMNAGANVAPNGLHLQENSFAPSSIHLNCPVPHELILRPNVPNTPSVLSYDAFSYSLFESSNFVTYEDIINELFN